MLSRTSVLIGGADGTDLGTQQLTASINTGTASHPWSIVLTDDDQLGWMTSNLQSGSINANSGGPSAAKPMRVDATGPLVFLPDIPLTAASYPEAIASTWDDRILYGLTFYADESEDNLLILDGNGGSLGASGSGPNNGRHRSRLAVSGDLFRVVSTHVVPNGMDAPVSYAVSFYNLP